MAKCRAKAKDGQLLVKVRLSLREKINQKGLDYFSNKNVGNFRGLLRVKQVKRNAVEYYGPISISLYQRLKKPIGKYEFFLIMEQIVGIARRLEQENLPICHVRFCLKDVFINKVTKELQLIYLPLEHTKEEPDILDLVYRIIYFSQPAPEQDMDYISRFTCFVRGLQRFEAESVEEFIRREDEKIVDSIRSRGTGTSGFITNKVAEYYDHYDRKRQKSQEEIQTTVLVKFADGSSAEKTGKREGADRDDEVPATEELRKKNSERWSDDEPVTEKLVEDDTTDLLGGTLHLQAGSIPYAALYRCNVKEWVRINRQVFRIGSEKSYSDYYISDNPSISSGHADIIVKRQKFLIMDLDSINGTYVNGERIPGRQEVELKNGDRLRLADEEFTFRC